MAKSFDDIKASYIPGTISSSTNNKKKKETNKKDYDSIKASSNSNVTGDTVNSFLDSSQKYLNRAYEDSSKVGYDNAKDLAYQYASDWAKLRNQSDEVRSYVNANRNLYGNKEANNIINYLDQLNSLSNNANQYYQNTSTEMASYKTKEDYDNALASAKEYYDRLSTNLGDSENEINYLEGLMNRMDTYEHIDQVLAETGYNSPSDIKDELSKKKKEYTVTKRIQDLYNAEETAKNDPDFKRYAQNASTIWKNKTDGTIFNPNGKSADPITYYRLLIKKNDPNQFPSSIDTEGNKAYKVAKDMTEDEYQTYLYYLGKEGKESADNYVSMIQDTLNYRAGQRAYNVYQGNPVMEEVYGLMQGIEGFGTQSRFVKNMLTGDDSYIPTTESQYAASMMREDLNSVGNIGGNDERSLGQMAFDLMQTTGNMLPSVIASYFTGGLAGMATNSALASGLSGVAQLSSAGMFGASAAGGAYQQMIQEGYSHEVATNYAVLTGASEAGLQYALGGITALGGKVPAKAIENFTAGLNNAYAKVAIGLGTNMLSEGTEEFLQDVLDPFFKEFATGEYREAIDWEEAIYSGIMGALSSIMFEFPEAKNSLLENAAIKKAYGEYQDRFIQEGLDAGDGTKASDIAKKAQEYRDKGQDLSGLLIKDLSEATDEANLEREIPEYTSYVQNELTSRGYDNAEEIASAVGKNAVGEKLTRSEAELIRGNDDVLDATRQYSQMRMQQIGKEESAKQKMDDVKTSIKDRISKDEEEATFSKILDDGKVELKDGSIVDNTKAIYKNTDQGYIVESLIRSGIETSAANAILNAYDPTINKNAMTYVLGMQEAYRYGTYNYPLSKASNNGFLSDITPSQKSAAYGYGKSASTSSVNRAISKINESVGNVAVNKGRVNFIGSAGQGLTEIQKASIATVSRVVSDITHNNVYFYQSKNVDGNIVYADNVAGHKAGEKAQNGFYQENGNIYIDINAGANSEGVILWTAAHELTHFVKQWSPEKFKKLSDFLMSEYGKKNVNVDRLVQRQYEIGLEHNKNFTYEDAFEEVVADSMQLMFTDTDMLSKLERLKIQDESLFNKVKKFIDDLFKKVSSLYKDLTPQTPEAEAVRKMKNSLEKLSDLFAEALVSAGSNYENVPISDTSSPKVSELEYKTKGTEMFQYRAMEADIPEYKKMLTAFGIDKKMITDTFNMVDKVIDKVKNNLEILDYDWELDIDDRAFNPVKPNSDPLYKNSVDFSTLCRKRILQQIVQIHLQEALDRAITKEESIAIRDELLKIQQQGREIEVACALCYVESARMKSPVQIQKFLDNRRAIITEYFATKDKENAPTQKEAEELKRKELSERYADEIAKEKMADPYEYTLTNKGDKKFIKLKALPQEVQKEIRQAKKEAKSSYKLKADEIRLLDIADGMTTADFTSPEGLAKLAKGYTTEDGTKSLFEAYTSYVRNATKSKGLEKDTWWRAGDSKAIADSLIEAMNSENGLRSQSWSDFQVIHTLDYIAAVVELSTRNAKMQVYTKVPDYVKLMGLTNQMINLSLIPEAIFDGTLRYDSVEGMPFEKALELRDKYPNAAGTICIGINNKQIEMLLASNMIDYVIPYHESGMSKVVRTVMKIPTWESYQGNQNESNVSKERAEELKAKYGLSLTINPNGDKWHKKPNFSEWFKYSDAVKAKNDFDRRAKEGTLSSAEKEMKKKYGKQAGAYFAMKQAADKYIKLCVSRGLEPKFSYGKADFSTNDAYWKLLIDRKMINQKTGEIIEQKSVIPKFKESDVLQILDDEVARYGKVKADMDYATKTVVGKFLSGDMNADINAIQKVTGAVQTSVDDVAAVSAMNTESITEKNSARVSDAEQENPTLNTLNGSKIQRSKYGVGKQMGSQIYVHKNYANEVIPADVWNKAKEIIPSDFSYNCVMYDTKNPNVVRFDEAPDFDTAREPKPGKMVYVDTTNGDITAAKGNGNMIWHHKWQWVRNKYEGFNVKESYEWSKEWLKYISNPSGSLKVWNEALEKNGLPIDSRDNTKYSRRNSSQGQSSEDTSLNQTPATFTNIKFSPTDRILDFGGGRYDTAKKAMENIYPGIKFEVMDMYNRTITHNDRIEAEFEKNPANYVTVNNVLNVIDSKEARLNVIEDSKALLKKGGTAIFLIYEGDKSGVGRITKEKADGETSSWQNNQKADFYVDEIKQFYKNVVKSSGGFIYASDGDIKIEKIDSETKKRIQSETTSLKKEKLDMKDSKYSTRETKQSADFADRILMGSEFSGGGMLEAGLMYKMIAKEFAVEYDEKIAKVYSDNWGEHIYAGKDNGDVLKFDIGKHSDDLYYLHASPVCHEFSKAKHGGKENEMDIKSAKKVAKDLETAMPQVFTVENAPAYLNSKSLKIITSKLEQLGYDWDADVYNSADYGSATSRERCIVRAVKKGTLPSKPAKTERSNSWDKVTKKYWSSLENAKARSGAAITESTLSAIRNTKKLQKYLNEDGTISVDNPLLILTTTSGHEVTFAEYGKLCPTLTTNCGEAKLILPGEHITFAHPNDNIKQVTPEFMGAIQGLEGYKYGDAKTRAFTIIGNGIPTQLTKAVMGGLLESSYRETHGKELYSSRTTPKEDRAYAPTFYSKMASVIDGIKTEKVGAGGVIPYLKGKGVKDEEIKWSGIQAFLDGKKSLTKAELQEFAKGSMLQIEEKSLGEYGETVYTDTETGVATTYEDINSSAEKYKNDNGYDSYNISSDRVGDITVDFYEGEDVVESLTFIKSTHNTKWSGSEYTSQSGTNYREILFKLPGSNYRNIAMERHWGDSGVLAHARIQDFYTENHGNMLFVEEVQSDWHNALEKSEKGISSKEELTLRKRLASLKEKVRKYNGLFTEEAKRIRLESKEELKEIKNQLKNKFGYDFSTINYEEFVPDAPFRSTYTDFVMKRLIREAAEKGYESIGWTSAQMQEDRWSSEFAEGYRIEYDQDIPKFMKKFGKQFGATVIQDTMGENQTYWVMDITPEMKESVLYKGQEMYSQRNVGYHAGDLGKAEPLSSQGYGRGTGHFGTGTYFVGDEAKISSDVYGARPHEVVDFSKYNLYKVHSSKYGEMLHKALKAIDGGIERKFADYLTDDSVVIAPYSYREVGEVSNVMDKYGWNSKGRVKGYTELLNNIGVEYDNRTEWTRKEKEEYPDAFTYYNGDSYTEDEIDSEYSEYLKEVYNSEKEKEQKKYEIIRDAFDDLSMLFTRKDVKAAIKKVVEYQENVKGKDNSTADSYATVFMKALGYEGIDVRGTSLDNTTYGSVIYDLKGEDLERKKEIGTARFSRRTDDSTDNRTLLANAFEEIATNAEELSNIREYKSKISELNRLQESLESIRRKINNSSIPKAERDAYKSEAERIAKKIYYADKSLIELESSEPLKRVIEREREVAIARAKEISNKRVQNYRDDRYKTEIRNKIKSLVTELNRRDFSPKKNRYIPYNLIKPVNELLSSINLDSGKYQSVSDKLAKLKVQYDAMKDDSRYYMSYDPVIAEMIQNLNDEVGDTSIYEMTTEQLNLVYKTLNSMMHTIRDAVKVKSSSIKMNGQELTAPEIAVNLIKETKDAKGIANELLYRYVKAQLRPSTMFERLAGFKKDSMWSKVYKLLNDGQTKEMQIQMESNDIFAPIFKNEKYLRSLTDTKNLVDFGLKDEEGNPVKVTRGMMLAIRKALDNDENARHILVGGITIPNLERYYDGKGNDPYGLNSYTVRGIASEGLIELNGRISDAIEDKRIAKEEGNKELAQQIQEEIDYMVSQRNEMMEDVVFMRQELITKINNLLTEEDTKLLALATDYFDTYSKNKLNEVTMDKYGFEKAQVDNYLPIHTNKDFRKASFEQIARDVSLENAGFMKDRVKAYNPIYLEDLTDMISSQIDKTAKYVGLMQAVADFQKIYGYTDQSFESSVQNAIRTKFDGVTINYIDNLITDVVGGRIGETTFLDRARGMTAQATLTLNPRVAAAQTASFPTAAAYLGWKPINKALKLGLMKADRDFIKQYTPILQARIDDGGFSEVADIKRMNSMADRTKAKLNFILGWISAMDTATVGRLWYASQFYVDEHFSEIEKGTDEYYRKTAEVFEECVQKTQPNYSVLQRPDILRNPNAAVKMLTMFMTQRLQNNNILYEAVGRYSKYKSDLAKGINGVTKEDLADAKWGVERAVTSRLAAGAMIVSIKFIVDAIMHSMNAYRDDDEELTPDSIFAKLFSNLLESEASNYLGGSEAYSYLYSVLTGERYYGVSLNGVSTISDFIEDSQKLASYAKEGLTSYGDLTDDEKDALSDKLISQLWKLTKDGAVVKGIPLANAEKMFNGFRYHLEDIKNGEFGSFEAGVERTKTQEVRRSYKAYLDGDMSKFNSIAIEQTYVTKYIKPMFLEAYRNNDNSTMAKLRKYLNATGLYKKDVVTITQDWIKNSNK